MADELRIVAVGRVLVPMPHGFEDQAQVLIPPTIGEYALTMEPSDLASAVTRTRTAMTGTREIANLDGSMPERVDQTAKEGHFFVFGRAVTLLVEREASVLRVTGPEYLPIAEHLSEMEALAARIEFRAVPALEEGFQFPGGIVLGAPMGNERAHLFWRTAGQQAAKAPSLGIAYQSEPFDGFLIGGVSRLAPLIEDSNSQPATIAGQDSIVVEASGSPEDGAFRTVVPRAKGKAPYFRIDLMTQPDATVFDTERETTIWQTVVQGARALPGTFQ